MESTLLATTVGILGGGQLARMLAEAAFRMGLHPIVLADGAQDPAARICPGSVFGSWNDPVVLRRFLSQAAWVTYENEFLPCDAVEKAAENLGTRFSPSLAAIYQLQDKLRQKELLSRLRIPTSPFVAFEPLHEDSSEWVRRMLTERFPSGCVLKWARLGYDGKGTWISSSHTDSRLGNQPGNQIAQAVQFCEEALKRGIDVYAEQKVDFRRELAVVAAHSTRGEFAPYPLVISEQQRGICRLVTGPAVSLGVDRELERRAHEYARKIAESLPIHGVFAIEMFETPEGELWVNELAPRVHNTGHYTLDAAATSQFENHWRALLGLPLGETRSAAGFAMLNLLGPAGLEGVAEPKGVAEKDAPLPGLSARAHLHWYGKAQLRPGRKLGHLNAQARSASEVPELVKELESCERRWIEEIQSERKK